MQVSSTIPRESGSSIAVLSCCLIPPGVVFLFFTAVIYHSNSDFIDFPFALILLGLIPMFLTAVAVLWIPTVWMKRKTRIVYGTILTVFGFLVWIVGNFLMSDRGMLDGAHPLRADSLLYQRSELAALCAAFILLVYSGWRFPKIVPKLATVLNLWIAGMLLITIVTDKKPYRLRASHDSFYNVSSKKNVFVFLFDTFQSDLFQDIITKDPSLRDKFEGFTYFPETAGVAPTTYLSLPAIHSGLEYSRGTSLASYSDRAIGKLSFLAKLRAAGYDGMMIGSIGKCPTGVSCFPTEQIRLGTWKSIWKEAFFLTDLSLYRSAPSILKQAVYRTGKFLTINLFFSYSRIIENNRFILEMTRRFSAKNDGPSVRFVHLMNTHPPVHVDSSCNPIDTKAGWTRKNAENQDTCAVHLLIDLLDSFKQKGIYDNSLIVVLADHGAGFAKPLTPAILASANPLLMVKPFRNHDRFRISGSAVSLIDIGKTICSLTGDCSVDKGFSMFDSAIPDARSVTYNDYRWKHEYWFSKNIPLNNQYSIIGPVDQILSWYKSTTPDHVRALHFDFSAPNPGEAFGFGWGPVEKWKGGNVRWGTGRYAQLYLALPQNQNVTLSMIVSTHARNRRQNISIYLDKTPVGGAAILPAIKQSLTFQIPAKDVVHPVSRLTFFFDQYSQVTKKFRPLAVAFYQIDAKSSR